MAWLARAFRINNCPRSMNLQKTFNVNNHKGFARDTCTAAVLHHFCTLPNHRLASFIYLRILNGFFVRIDMLTTDSREDTQQVSCFFPSSALFLSFFFCSRLLQPLSLRAISSCIDLFSSSLTPMQILLSDEY